MLEPGASVTGTYLWRDVSRCDGAASDVEPGTYTLLASTSLYVSNYAQMYSSDGASTLEEPAVKPLVPESRTLTGDGDVTVMDDADDMVGSGASGSGSDSAVAPVGDDWVDLQMWESLGSIRVQ